jgi:hypothetical protein
LYQWINLLAGKDDEEWSHSARVAGLLQASAQELRD